MMMNLRILIVALCVTIMFAACNNEPEKPVVNPTEQAQQLIDEHFRYLNDHDLKSLVAQYAAKAKITTTDWDGESIGPQGADQLYHQLFYVSPDAKYLVDNVINADSVVVVEYDVVGLKQKANDPIRHDVRNCSVFKIKNNAIISEATYSNPRLYHNN